MQVYKAFFKIVKSNLTEIIIYAAVFLFFGVVLGNNASSPTDTDFTETKVNIAFINNDENSLIIDGIKEYLEEHANIVDIKNDKNEFQDALFFREAEYIIKIPKGFTDKILNNDKNVKIEKHTIPNSVSEVYMDNIINRYLNTVKMYTSTIKDISQNALVKYVNKDLSYSTKVEISEYESGYTYNSNCKNYYNYLPYTMFAILVLGVSSVMVTFNDKDIRMRNLSSALTLRSFGFQMILGNITFAIALWFIIVVISFIMYKNYMFSINGFLLLLNSFAFTIAALSISLLIGNIVKSRNAMSGAANIVSLGSCFISGVFVPQEYLGDTVINIARFNPTYWYIKANNEISLLVNYNKENITPIAISMLIMLGFSLTIFAITLVVMKQRRLS